MTFTSFPFSTTVSAPRLRRVRASTAKTTKSTRKGRGKQLDNCFRVKSIRVLKSTKVDEHPETDTSFPLASPMSNEHGPNILRGNIQFLSSRKSREILK